MNAVSQLAQLLARHRCAPIGLFGNSGCGKTFLASAIAARRIRNGVPVIYLSQNCAPTGPDFPAMWIRAAAKLHGDSITTWSRAQLPDVDDVIDPLHTNSYLISFSDEPELDGGLDEMIDWLSLLMTPDINRIGPHPYASAPHRVIVLDEIAGIPVPVLTSFLLWAKQRSYQVVFTSQGIPPDGDELSFGISLYGQTTPGTDVWRRAAKDMPPHVLTDLQPLQFVPYVDDQQGDTLDFRPQESAN